MLLYPFPLFLGKAHLVLFLCLVGNKSISGTTKEESFHCSRIVNLMSFMWKCLSEFEKHFLTLMLHPNKDFDIADVEFLLFFFK